MFLDDHSDDLARLETYVTLGQRREREKGIRKILQYIVQRQ